MLKTLKVLLTFVIILSSFSCVAKEITGVNVQEIETKVYLSRWDKKGFGDKIATSTISIITAPDYKGDIVVLRKNANDSGFTAEVYKPEESDTLTPRSWEFTFGDIEKSIVRQSSGKFHLSERVSEGIKFEVIDLDGND